MQNFRAAILVGAALSCAAPAAAQTWSERVHISVNGAFQTAANDFSDRFEFEKDLETGSTATEYKVSTGFLFDAGGGVRLWKNLGAGVAASFFTRKDTATTVTRSPHPFFFNQLREVTGDAPNLTRTETAVHVQAMYFINPSGPLRLVLSAGPSFYNVEQDLVASVALTETFPYDTAEFSSARSEKSKGSAPAFNAGADVMWMLTRKFGVGGILRFSRATVDLDAPNNRTVSVDVGGFYAGGGIRLLF
jgi:hypothetical protein